MDRNRVKRAIVPEVGRDSSNALKTSGQAAYPEHGPQRPKGFDPVPGTGKAPPARPRESSKRGPLERVLLEPSFSPPSSLEAEEWEAGIGPPTRFLPATLHRRRESGRKPAVEYRSSSGSRTGHPNPLWVQAPTYLEQPRPEMEKTRRFPRSVKATTQEAHRTANRMIDGCRSGRN